MSFMRPEARATLGRWSEALVGGAIALLGVFWALTGLGFFRGLGVVLIIAGGALAYSGVQRARFRTNRGGLGVVEVDERQITYLAPVGGGVISLDSLTNVTIARDTLGRAVWRFSSVDERLSVPTNAEGAKSLFDALTSLPGAGIETAIRALNAPPETPVTIWSKRK